MDADANTDADSGGYSNSSSALKRGLAHVYIFMLRFMVWRNLEGVSLITWFLKLDQSRDRKHRGEKSLDLSSLPMKNPIFQHSIFKISGFLKIKFRSFWKSIFHYTYFQKYFLIICCKICKISFNCCIEVNDKHRVCPSGVMAQTKEYISFLVLVNYAMMSRRLWEWHIII